MHPFYPKSLVIPNYKPSPYTMAEILFPFFGAVALVLVVSYGLISGRKHTLSNSQGWTKAVFTWFICSGLIHLIIEGYYAANVYDIAGQTNYMSSMWKEYALSDSRYMTIDSTVWMIESITAWGW
jgi:cholestenol delta-isomerase